jgi:hypothetical protein
MGRHSLSCGFLRPTHMWGIVAALLASCGTGPDIERLEDGVYDRDYDPPPVTRMLPGCDRLLSRVFLVISSRGSFELGINVIDDCSRSGKGFSYFGVSRNGGYYVDGSELTFLANTGTSGFSGFLEGEYIRLLLPPALELALSELEVRVGPRSDF